MRGGAAPVVKEEEYLRWRNICREECLPRGLCRPWLSDLTSGVGIRINVIKNGCLLSAGNGSCNGQRQVLGGEMTVLMKVKEHRKGGGGTGELRKPTNQATHM